MPAVPWQLLNMHKPSKYYTKIIEFESGRDHKWRNWVQEQLYQLSKINETGPRIEIEFLFFQMYFSFPKLFFSVYRVLEVLKNTNEKKIYLSLCSWQEKYNYIIIMH
jgi:hypothetical protein